MRIAARLAGTLMLALLLSPAAATAEPAPANRSASESSNAQSVRESPQVAGQRLVDEDLLARLKKKKKPHFQTRFFAE